MGAFSLWDFKLQGGFFAYRKNHFAYPNLHRSDERYAHYHRPHLFGNPAAVLSWENETLLVGFQDCRHFVFLGGDLAASEDQILARGKVSEIWFAQDLQHFWKDEETEEGRLMALRRHFPKVPSVLLERIVKIQAYRSTSDRI